MNIAEHRCAGFLDLFIWFAYRRKIVGDNMNSRAILNLIRTRSEVGFSAVLLLTSTAAFAHHSTAAYDQTKPTKLTGTVKELQWTNPHSWIQLVVAGKGGASTEWAIEFGNPVINLRNGWKRGDVKRGDKVAVVIYPQRDGSNHGTLATITMADGRTLDGAANFVPKAIQKVAPPPPK